MRITIHHHYSYDSKVSAVLHEVLTELKRLTIQTNKLMASQSEIAQQLTDLSTQLDKSLNEINAEITKLQDAIATAGNSTPEVDAALASLKAKVQQIDDLNADPSTGGTDGTTEPTA